MDAGERSECFISEAHSFKNKKGEPKLTFPNSNKI
jgi:hypothetical protein